MRIVTHKAIVQFYKNHNDATTALETWYKKTIDANWTCFADLKKSFNAVDSVGNKRYVFNIKGNDYRLIVKINYDYGLIWIRFIGTHKQYDKINAETI